VLRQGCGRLEDHRLRRRHQLEPSFRGVGGTRPSSAGSPVATLVRAESTHSTPLDEIKISYCSGFNFIYLSPKQSTACTHLSSPISPVAVYHTSHGGTCGGRVTAGTVLEWKPANALPLEDNFHEYRCPPPR
jgi:hypothetical protein